MVEEGGMMRWWDGRVVGWSGGGMVRRSNDGGMMARWSGGMRGDGGMMGYGRGGLEGGGGMRGWWSGWIMERWDGGAAEW